MEVRFEIGKINFSATLQSLDVGWRVLILAVVVVGGFITAILFG